MVSCIGLSLGSFFVRREGEKGGVKEPGQGLQCGKTEERQRSWRASPKRGRALWESVWGGIIGNWAELNWLSSGSVMAAHPAVEVRSPNCHQALGKHTIFLFCH